MSDQETVPEAPEGGAESQQPDIEARARSMGWKPRDEFNGEQTRWVDAQQFVENGERILPIMRIQNQKLEAQIAKQQAELQAMRNNFQASQEAIAQLKQVHEEATRIAVERAKAELKTQLREARSEGDIDAEMAIREQMDDLTAQERAAAAQRQATPPPAQQPAEQQLHPDWAAWQAENKWFGTDERKTLRAMGIAQELRSDPDLDHLQGREFFDKVLDVMNERYGGTPTGKVGSTRPSAAAQASGAGGAPRGKSYADMPSEAREACDRQGRRLIGEGRAFKDASAWRSYYAKLYFQE